MVVPNYRERRDRLFNKDSRGMFNFRVNTDALSSREYEDIAGICGPRLPRFGAVYHVDPSRQLLCEAFRRHQSSGPYPALLCHDVYEDSPIFNARAAELGLDGSRTMVFVIFACCPKLPPNLHAFWVAGHKY